MVEVLPVRNRELESINLSKINTWCALNGAEFVVALDQGIQRSTGHSLEKRIHTPHRVEIIVDLFAVSGNGAPSKNFSVPIVVATVFGVIMLAGI
jgi:hypothetical protein